METVLQSSLPFAPWVNPATRRLPGTMPAGPRGWLMVDDAYAGQMALRRRLIAEETPRVHALTSRAEEAAAELYEAVLDLLPDLGVTVSDGQATGPDGVPVPLDPAAPLLSLGRVVQEDLCIMQEGESGEYDLTGAVLCFPSGWTLAEKIGRPMIRIHVPVKKYDPELARRVGRLMEGVQPGRPMLRGTAHWSGAPLFNPRTEAQGNTPGDHRPLIRVERQCLLRLPRTRAVAFTIHTFAVRPEALSPEQAKALAAHPLRSVD